MKARPLMMARNATALGRLEDKVGECSFMTVTLLDFYHQQRRVITERIAVCPDFAGFPQMVDDFGGWFGSRFAKNLADARVIIVLGLSFPQDKSHKEFCLAPYSQDFR
jgi:hypothetical protein